MLPQSSADAYAKHQNKFSSGLCYTAWLFCSSQSMCKLCKIQTEGALARSSMNTATARGPCLSVGGNTGHVLTTTEEFCISKLLAWTLSFYIKHKVSMGLEPRQTNLFQIFHSLIWKPGFESSCSAAW